jgi:hypothetical protein
LDCPEKDVDMMTKGVPFAADVGDETPDDDE